MSGSIRPRRSVLYMPGVNERALEKARGLAADCLILDLEDSVAPDAKEAARELVCAAARDSGYGDREVIVRINDLASDWGARDLAAVAVAGVDGVLLPKVNDAENLLDAANRLRSAGAPEKLQLWVMMETPDAILNARRIAGVAAHPAVNLTCLVMGTNDLLKETRASFTSDRSSVLAWLSQVVLAARACGVDVVDGVYNDLRDEDGLRTECAQGRALGFDGKTLIHPAQIAPCNAIFSPSEDEIVWARKVIAAFREPRNAGKGVIAVDGRMVELLHAQIAERIVAIADAIERRRRTIA